MIASASWFTGLLPCVRPPVFRPKDAGVFYMGVVMVNIKRRAKGRIANAIKRGHKILTPEVWIEVARRS